MVPTSPSEHGLGRTGVAASGSRTPATASGIPPAHHLAVESEAKSAADASSRSRWRGDRRIPRPGSYRMVSTIQMVGLPARSPLTRHSAYSSRSDGS